MSQNNDSVRVGKLVKEPPSAAILTVLLDRRFYPISDLANMTRIDTQDVNQYVTMLVEEDIIDTDSNGRHHYYGINTDMEETVSSALSEIPDVKIRRLKSSREKEAVAHARTCYSHIAGSLGVELTDALLEKAYIESLGEKYYVTDKGETFFSDIKINIEGQQLRGKKCLDWTERRHHIKGPLGKALLEGLLELNWIERVPSSRALKITTKGEKELRRNFSIEI